MKDEIRSVFLMGIGAAALTRKKAEQTIRKFVDKGIIDTKQAKELADKVMKEAKKVKEKLEKEGRKEVTRIKKKAISTGKKARNEASRILNGAAKKAVRKGMKI